VWNGSAVTPASVPITINLPQTFSTINQYDPQVGSGIQNTVHNQNSISVSLGKDALIFELF
jgi:hypothetical protein